MRRPAIRSSVRRGRGAWQAARPLVPRERQELFFLLAHLGLGVVFRTFPLAATLHGLGVWSLGMVWALTGRVGPATAMAGYVAAADVLWRMTGSHLPYEFAKYAAASILLATLRRPVRPSPLAGLAILYFACLLPSISLTAGEAKSFFEWRSLVSFTLSGNLILAVAVAIFSSRPLLQLNLRRLLLSSLAPPIAIFGLAAHSTITAEQLHFGTESNRVTSGGFGPNQVSLLLAAGILLIVCRCIQTDSLRLRVVYAVIGLALFAQMLLTFSRGGAYSAGAALALLILNAVRNRSWRRRLLGTLVVGLALVVWVVLPVIDNLTEGAFTQRFSDTSPGLRLSIAQSELAMFAENPILGVGPGLGKYHRRGYVAILAASHTEFTRLLGEHGVLGLTSLFLMVLILVLAYRWAPSPLARGWVTMWFGWSAVGMFAVSTRVAMIGYAIGLATVAWPRPVPRSGQVSSPGTTQQVHHGTPISQV